MMYTIYSCKRGLFSFSYVACAVIIALIIEGNARASDASVRKPAFDIETLKSREIDPRLAELLSGTARFLPGREKVTLFVNGERVGRLYAMFDTDGKLCFDSSLLSNAGLKVPKNISTQQQPNTVQIKPSISSGSDSPPASVSGIFTASHYLSQIFGPVSFWSTPRGENLESDDIHDTNGQCYDFIAAWPQTEVDLRPGTQEVYLLVPSDALRKTERDVAHYDSGGTAAILNYDALTMQNQSSGSHSEYSSLSTEAGFNIGDWALRSRHNLIEQNGERNTQNLYTYAQHTYLPLKSLVQIGQIDINSPLFAGVSMTGMQLIPDKALLPESRGGVIIEGLAQTSQARVEVKQNGLLIHSSVVPAGPFVLPGILLLQVNTNVDVTVFESDGTQHTSSIPAASLRRANLSPGGWAISAGKVRQTGNSSIREPGVMALSNDWLLGKYSQLTSGLMLSDEYRSTGFLVDSVFGQETSLSFGSVISQAREEGKKGIQNTLAFNTRFSEWISANASATQQSHGYRDLIDTLVTRPSGSNASGGQKTSNEDEMNNSDTQLSAGMNWHAQRFGGGGVSFIQSKTADGEWGRTLSVSWAININRITLSTTWQKELKGQNGDSLFMSLSIPLERSSNIQARVSRSDDNHTRLMTTYNDTVSESFNYSLSASRQGSGNGTDLSGNLSAIPRYAQLNLGYTQNGNDSNNFNAGIRGALVLHREGITPSPNQIQDTFGIISVGDEAGVKIRTPGGTVWTDAGGKAVVSQFSSWRESQVEVVTNTLPRNVDINNGYRNVEAGRGSVSRVDFNIVKVRRVLLSAHFADGKSVPKGSSVLDKDGNYLTTVVDNGHIFLQDARQQTLLVYLLSGEKCQLDFQLPEKAETESYFENADAICMTTR